jgi:hypothetical protein
VEAKEWPRWKDDAPSDSPGRQTVTHSNGQSEGKPCTSESVESPSSIYPPTTSTKPSQLPKSAPRKRKTLGSIPFSKPKKLSTLDKSALDWSSHVSSSSNQHIRDELEANRRGGGYIERMEFMERVSERKEEGRTMLAGSKRRRH